jgi:hypothetical protein
METTHTTLTNAASGATLLIGFAIGLAVYIFFCYCLKLICSKCGVESSILIWFPLLQLIPLIQASGLPTGTFILFLIPLVNIVMAIVMWAKICGARGKGVLAILLVLILPVIGIPYLAFSE